MSTRTTTTATATAGDSASSNRTGTPPAVKNHGASTEDNEEWTIREALHDRKTTSMCLICHEGCPDVAMLCCNKDMHFSCMVEWLRKGPTAMCNTINALEAAGAGSTRGGVGITKSGTCPHCRSEVTAPPALPSFDEIETLIHAEIANALDELPLISWEPHQEQERQQQQQYRLLQDISSYSSSRSVGGREEFTHNFSRSSSRSSSRPHRRRRHNTLSVYTDSSVDTADLPPMCLLCSRRLSARNCANFSCHHCCLELGHVECLRHNLAYRNNSHSRYGTTR